MSAPAQCPFHATTSRTVIARSQTNAMWFPHQGDLSILRQHDRKSDPLGPGFDYRTAFATLDLAEVKAEITALMTHSQDWWPADYGHYGPLFIRMAWHSAGTYRTHDGRGGAGNGTQRFAPLSSWPDNGNLDKARLLLWPIKARYGQALSWGDLMILAGNCALEAMGLPTAGFGGGREDVWHPELDIDWGPESEWLGNERYGSTSAGGERALADPLAAVQMGLIYVNPEGPDGVPDPLGSARDIRETFARMAMNDEETVALIAGGHTFGKAHGAGDAALVGPAPAAAPLEAQGLGWLSDHGTGMGGDTITSGLEGAWTPNPIRWDNGYFDTLFGYEWELTRSPAGAHQWTPKQGAGADTVPDAHDRTRRHAPMMLTSDIALITDPAYRAISEGFHRDPLTLARAFAEAWLKLTHRDMGPIERYLGADAPRQPRLWMDPVPVADHALATPLDVAMLKAQILGSGIAPAILIRTAWASASTFRHTDRRGGANGARIRLAPQRDWAVNEPAVLRRVLAMYERVQAEFNARAPGGRQVSLADLIVLGGGAAIEAAARAGGHDIIVPFTPGRTDTTDELTDAASFAVLEPTVDGFRNFIGAPLRRSPEELLIDRAHLLGLTAPAMTALVGGLRVLGANPGGSQIGTFTRRVGVLSNDFFHNLLDATTTCRWAPSGEGVYTAFDRQTGEAVWHASRVDLLFGSHAELRALSEVYASADGEAYFLDQFVSAWVQVMDADRFDLM